MSLISAGTTLPASRITKSPGTTSFDEIEIMLPSRITAAVGEAIIFNASIAFSALYSWINPITAFMITITTMAIVSTASPITPEIIAAMISIMIMKSMNWAISIPRGPFFFASFNSLGPYSRSLRFISPWERPL
ncbi:MAG: hypothetical protein UU48_C0040G0003 [Candidatus Uhrbacteria bacterium GW2011_GWF2_41_16]|uniref:Uncharacterized protein n=1 Tax=Candidatus Uhrbacteria bacterium GW2011_GWF2_41_16 TaxID=1618997 RepID=A0A0G0V4J8_9BACT|nr:MAG: hypothetical protein UU48_C0040G0003 [Candidatus Uhrbacteria bacterium GW2011_GWF2_41_16]